MVIRERKGGILNQSLIQRRILSVISGIKSGRDDEGELYYITPPNE